MTPYQRPSRAVTKNKPPTYRDHDQDSIDLDPQPKSSSSSSKHALARGKACLTCRRRKMRCDGKRPICGQCKNGHREAECEFDEGRAKSRTQLLMENVSRLEQRLQELQKNPSSLQRRSPNGPMSIPLHPPPVVEPSFFDSSLPLYPQVGNSTLPGEFDPQQPAVWDEHLLFDQSNQWLAAFDSSLLATTSSGAGSDYQRSTTLTPDVQTTLLQTFLIHQHQFGIDLTPEIIAELGRTPLSGEPQLVSPLLNAILLWGCRLQSSPHYRQFEEGILTKCLEDITEALSDQDLAMNVLQASTLISTYFFSSGRLLEGKYHADASAALVVALDMHKMTAAQDAVGLSPTSEDSHYSSSQGSSAMFSEEKLTIFWNVFELGCWTVATGSHAPLIVNQDPRALIHSPWPKSSNHLFDFETPDVESSILDFLLKSHVPMSQQEDPLSLRAKSAALLQLSTRLSATISEAEHAPQSILWEKFQSLEHCINKSSVSLGPLPYCNTMHTSLEPPEEFFHLIIVHSFLSTAMILLHHQLARRNPTSQDKCQTWARKMLYTVEQIPMSYFSSLNPMLAMCWAVAADVILQEILINKTQFATQARIMSLEGELDSLLNAMAELSKTHPIAEILSRRITPQYAEAKQA